ncbi:50S ribosomal protein L4 [Patescibacteria group bacterium]
MPKIDLYTTAGLKSGKLDLPKDIFGAKVNEVLMAQAVRVYLSNQRRAKAKIKNRSEVRGSRRKIWRQKGTGRARHGDRYAPIFVGGGRAHGPTGQQNYQLKLSKKMRRLALFSALTSKYQSGDVLVVKGLEKVKPKTKEMAQIVKNFSQPTDQKKAILKLTIVLPEVVESVIRGTRNIPRVRLVQANLLNTYEVLNGGRLVLMDKSIGAMKERFLAKPKKKSALKKS